MKLIVGLGNLGKKYEKTRHNIGFQVIDEFQNKNNFPLFKLEKIFLSEISKGVINNEKIILVKPRTFMNLSGKAVKILVKNFFKRISLSKISKNLFVIHDDIDLPLGKIKISVNRGSGGHKGIESIIKELKTRNFVRFRVGIQPKTNKPKNIENFVLGKFNKREEKIIKEIIKKTSEAIEFSLQEGLEKTMSRYNNL